MKIMQYCDNFYPQVDGVIKVVDNYARIMNERETAKVVVPQYKMKQSNDLLLSYEVLRRPAFAVTFKQTEVPLPKKAGELTKKIQEYSADIYHAHSPFFIGNYALKLARKHHVPIVATFHSQFEKDALTLTHSKLITKCLVKSVVRFFNRCDEVWAPSKSTAEVLKSYGYKKEIFIMENGTDFNYFNNAKDLRKLAMQKYGIALENKNLLFVGQLRAIKNIPLLLQTTKNLVEKDKTYHLYLVGEGMDQAEYQAWSVKNNLQSNIHFLGKIIDSSLLAGVYSACDLFFFPSSYDNAPIVIREASVMQLPSLVTVNSPTAEPFVDNVNGYLAEESVTAMQEKIMQIFAQPLKMKAVGKRASQQIPISFDKTVDKALQRYQYIIDQYHQRKNEKTRHVK